jgi:MoaA/NifB/PqqE/SkfB family radical SAM enzyme
MLDVPSELVRRQLNRITHRIHALPVVILLPHSRCNCRCVMCDIWKANHERRELTAADLEPHVESLRQWGTRRVVLSGGEALMHSNLWALCALLRPLGIKITLLSTGLLLRRHAASVTAWCDDVIVSLDGPAAIHDQIRRVPGAFDRLAEGVAALRTAQTPFRVTARCVLQRRNFRHVGETIAAARQLALDGISFLAADVSSEAFNRPTPWSGERVSDIALSRAEVDELWAVLDDVTKRYASEFATGFVAESPDKFGRIARYFTALLGEGDFPPVSCNAPWVSTVIEADGTVRPCFFHRALGNVNDRPLGEILNSTDAVTFRRELDVKTNATCRRCVCTLNLGPREWI